MNAKRFNLLVVFTLLVTIFIGSGAIVKAQDEPQKVSLWYYWGDTGRAAEALFKYKDLWEASQSKCTLDLRSIPTADFKRELSTAILAGSMPDMAIIDNPDHALFSAQGVLAQLDDRIDAWGQEDQYLPGPWNSTLWDGHNYGVPVGSNTIVLWINNALATEAGLDLTNPPKTWDELMEWAGALTNPDKNQYGITLVAERNEPTTFMWLPFLMQTGESLETLDSEGGVAALQLWVDFVEKGYASPEIVNYGFGDIPGQFQAGNAAMMLDGPWVLNSIAEEAPDLEFTLTPLPIPEGGQQASSLGGENFAIFDSSDHKDCAWDFITFTQAPENVEDWYISLGYFPSRSDVAEASDYWKTDPHMAVFLEQMKSAMPRGPLPNWPEVSEVIQLMLQEALTGQVSAEDAISNAAPQIDALLAAN